MKSKRSKANYWPREVRSLREDAEIIDPLADIVATGDDFLEEALYKLLDLYRQMALLFPDGALMYVEDQIRRIDLIDEDLHELAPDYKQRRLHKEIFEEFKRRAGLAPRDEMEPVNSYIH
jgi:hypothetical protein